MGGRRRYRGGDLKRREDGVALVIHPRACESSAPDVFNTVQRPGCPDHSCETGSGWGIVSPVTASAISLGLGGFLAIDTQPPLRRQLQVVLAHTRMSCASGSPGIPCFCCQKLLPRKYVTSNTFPIASPPSPHHPQLDWLGPLQPWPIRATVLDGRFWNSGLVESSSSATPIPLLQPSVSSLPNLFLYGSNLSREAEWENFIPYLIFTHSR